MTSGSTSSDSVAKPGFLAPLQRAAGTLAPLSFLLLLCLVLWRIAPNFATHDNLQQIAIQSAVVAILACGQTVVIISGNIDLSVGSVMAFAGVVAAVAMHDHGASIPVAVLLSCLAGLMAGTVTGLVTAYGRIPSFIVSLGMLNIARGMAGIASHSVNVGGLPAAFSVFGTGELFGSSDRDGIPYPIIILAGAAIVVFIALARTRWGRSVYAVGGNQEAARLSGIRLTWVLTSVFALSGLLAGVAAVVNLSRTSVASMAAGDGLELDAIAATVVGGTSLFGGKGSIGGTIIGAVLINTIRNGCILRGYTPDYQRAIIGAVIVLAVLFDRYGPGKNKSA